MVDALDLTLYRTSDGVFYNQIGNGLNEKLLAFKDIVNRLRCDVLTSNDIENVIDMIFSSLKLCIQVTPQSELEFVTFIQIVSNAAERYNQLGADFQDTWSENYWLAYNKIREQINSPSKILHDRDRLDSASMVSIQDLNYISRSDHFPKYFSPTLRRIDEESNKFRSSSIKTKASQTDEICKNCNIL